MFEDLPSKIESRVDPDFKKRRRFHPMMIEELLHMGKEVKSHIPILMALSLFRNDFPWIYEMGNETLKLVQLKKSPKEKEMAVRDFLEIFEFTFRHPMMREMTMGSKEYHMMFRETQHFLERYFHRYIVEPKEE
jgi:hypothetical protein